MKRYIYLFFLFSVVLFSCSGDKKNKQPDYSLKTKKEVKKIVDKPIEKTTQKEKIYDLSNKGIGSVKSLKLPEKIDQEMAKKGKQYFKNKCTACHRIGRRFIGPDVTGILEKRSPEWIMNIMMNPEEMLKKDPIAKQLLKDYNGAIMPNQNVTEEDARALLEYFRTLE